MALETEISAHRKTISQYQEDMYPIMKGLTKAYIPNYETFKYQPVFKPCNRFYLVDFLLEKYHQLQLSSEVFFGSINLIDRYCSKRQLEMCHVDLLGLTCLWICAKTTDNKLYLNNEVYNKIDINCMIRITNGTFSKSLFKDMEVHILETIDWSLYYPSQTFFIEYFINIFSKDKFGKYFDFLNKGALLVCEICTYSTEISFSYDPFNIAYAALIITNNSYCLRKYGKIILPRENEYNQNENTKFFHLDDINLFTEILNVFQNNLPFQFKKYHFEKDSSNKCDNLLLINSIYDYSTKLNDLRIEKHNSSSISNSEISESSYATNDFENSCENDDINISDPIRFSKNKQRQDSFTSESSSTTIDYYSLLSISPSSSVSSISMEFQK